MKFKSILSLAIICLAFSVQAQQATGALDGKKFSITLMKNGTIDSKESLVFEKGTMDALQCHQYGFGATSYQGKSAAGMQTFAVICKSDKEGEMAWQGKVTGDQIEGSVVWTKTGQDPIAYTFKGTADKAGK